MKNKKTNPYGIDVVYEYKTYSHVGPNCKAGSEKNFLTCKTYSEWKEHVKSTVGQELLQSENLIYWLRDQRNIEKRTLDIIRTVLIPIYIALLAFYNVFLANETPTRLEKVAFLLSYIIIIVIVSTCLMYKANEKVDFYDDFIEIVENEKE